MLNIKQSVKKYWHSGVGKPAPWWYQEQQDRELVNALEAGTKAMREHALQNRFALPRAGDHKYLKLANCTKWERKVNSAYLKNVWRSSVDKATSMPFRSEARMDGWPSYIEDWMEAVDDEGAFWTFLHRVFRHAGYDGVSHVLVDSGTEGNEPPYLVEYRAAAVIRTSTRRRGGKIGLDAVHLEEPDQSISDEEYTFGATERPPQIRVLKVLPTSRGPQVHWALYRWNDSIEEVPEGMMGPWDGGGKWERVAGPLPIYGRSNNPVDEILLTPIYAHRTGPWRGSPPFSDAAEEQAAHWRSNLDLLNLEGATAVPLLFQSGIKRNSAGGEEVTGGSPAAPTDEDGMLFSEDAQADAKMVETTGAALGHLDRRLQTMARSIQDACDEPLQEQPVGRVSAQEIGLRGGRASTRIDSWAIFLESASERILRAVCTLMGDPESSGTCEITRSWGPSAAVVSTATELARHKLLHPKILYKVLESAGQWPSGITVEEAVELWEDAQAEKKMTGEQVAAPELPSPPELPNEE